MSMLHILTTYFNSNNLSYFELYYNRKLTNIVSKIKYINNKIYFYNINNFIDSLKDIVYTKSKNIIY